MKFNSNEFYSNASEVEFQFAVARFAFEAGLS